jgi:putative nucleotidyltransferase with HDIG domain
MKMNQATKDAFVSKLLKDLDEDRLVLPTLPEVAIKVRDTLEDENASMKQVAEVIGTDAALTARIIQVANSPLLRTSRPSETVDAAVARMGSTMVRNLVTSMVMEQMFQATTEATDKRLRAIWEHSVQVAAIAHALAGQFTRLQPDQAMLAGLVHDIGTLPILSRAEDVPELLEDEAALDDIIAETHTRLGAAILEKWHFPAELIAAVAEHETLGRDHEGEAEYADVVIVANLQSHLGSDHRLTQVDWGSVPAFGKLGLAFDVNVVDMDETSADIEAVKMALSA